MYKFFDYSCTNIECERRNIVEERMIEDGEVVICEGCKTRLEKLMPAPKGYVIGTDNPVKQ